MKTSISNFQGNKYVGPSEGLCKLRESPEPYVLGSWGSPDFPAV